jgi:tetratricopeptide (TPR) repeat protein
MKKEERISKLLEMKVLNPNDPFPTYALALEYMNVDSLDDALRYLLEVKINFPDYLPCYYQLGTLYEKMLKPVDAVNTYREGISVEEIQRDAKTLNELQQALLVLED